MPKPIVAECLNNIAEGLTRAAANCVTLANLLEDDTPDVPPVVVPPKPKPKTKRVFGINLGRPDHYGRVTIYNDALFMATRLAGTNISTGSGQFDENGDLISGSCLTRFMTYDGIHAAGEWEHIHGGEVVGTVQTQSNVPDAFRDIIMRGDARGDELRHTGTHSKFSPDFLQRLEGVGVLRFMDMRRTNYRGHATGIDDWYRTEDAGGGRVLVSPTVRPSQAVEIANAVGASGIWWNFLWGEPIERIEATAEYFRDNWNGTLHYEYGNELWNWAFPDAPIKEVASGSTDYPGIHRKLTARAAACSNIVAAIDPGSIFTLSVQVVNYEVTRQLLAGDIGNIKAVAIAPYWPHVDGSKFDGTSADLTKKARVTLDELKTHCIWQRDNAAKLGLQCVGYEGGHHVWHKPGQPQLATMQAWTRGNEIAEMYREFADFWEREIGTPLCWFNDCDETCFALTEYPQHGPTARGKVVYDSFKSQGN